jgi:hydrogenase 3 maturation protease
LKDSELVTEQTPSIADWPLQLREVFKLCSKQGIAFVGVGHPFRGDDYVGSFVLKELGKHSNFPPSIHLYDAEDNVESFVSKLVELKPGCIIFVDSCQLNARPGETRLVPVAETGYPFFTTHGIPLKVLCERMLPRCQAWVLAVQPEQVEFSDTLSPTVRRAAFTICDVISKSVKEIIA